MNCVGSTIALEMCRHDQASKKITPAMHAKASDVLREILAKN